MSARTTSVSEGPRSQTLNNEGDFQVLEVHISGIGRPCMVMIDQAEWDARSPESHELALSAVDKAVEQVLLTWNIVDQYGQDAINQPLS